MSNAQTLLRGPQLRQRWGMKTGTFYNRLKSGAIPKPIYPFGGTTPYWSVADIEAFEQKAMQQTVAA